MQHYFRHSVHSQQVKIYVCLPINVNSVNEDANVWIFLHQPAVAILITLRILLSQVSHVDGHAAF